MLIDSLFTQIQGLPPTQIYRSAAHYEDINVLGMKFMVENRLTLNVDAGEGVDFDTTGDRGGECRVERPFLPPSGAAHHSRQSAPRFPFPFFFAEPPPTGNPSSSSSPSPAAAAPLPRADVVDARFRFSFAPPSAPSGPASGSRSIGSRPYALGSTLCALATDGRAGRKGECLAQQLTMTPAQSKARPLLSAAVGIRGAARAPPCPRTRPPPRIPRRRSSPRRHLPAPPHPPRLRQGKDTGTTPLHHARHAQHRRSAQDRVAGKPPLRARGRLPLLLPPVRVQLVPEPLDLHLLRVQQPRELRGVVVGWRERVHAGVGLGSGGRGASAHPGEVGGFDAILGIARVPGGGPRLVQ